MVRSRRRGEGYVEYAVIMMLVMVCSVVGLLRAGSTAIDQVATSQALCSNCPETRLSADQIKELRELLDNQARTAEDDRRMRDLADARAAELEGRRNEGVITPDEEKELDDINRALGDRAATTDGAAPASSGGFWDSVFGPNWWEDSYLVSFMAIFGWFGFFG